MSPETLTLILGISGGVILLLIAIVGFFMARTISAVQQNTTEIGKNKGRIELVEQQQQNDVKRIEQMTQLEISKLADNVSQLSTNVNTLVGLLAQNSIDKKNG